MKDYRLSEIKDICKEYSKNKYCAGCPFDKGFIVCDWERIWYGKPKEWKIEHNNNE